MKKSNLLFAFITLFFFSFIVSCSEKDDTEPQDQQTQEAPTLETKIVELPEAMTQSNDPGAQMATMYANMANGFTGWAGMMIPPQKSASLKSTLDGDPWVYTWDFSEGADAYSITLTIAETPTEYLWTMVINGTLGGMVLDNFLYMEANEALDGTSGEFVMYDPEEQGIGLIASWVTNSNGVYSLTFEMPGEVKIVLTTNLDNSGEISVYDWNETEYLLSFNASWDSTGHGEYWEYDAGELVDHGTW